MTCSRMSNETCRKATLVPTIPRDVAAAIESLRARGLNGPEIADRARCRYTQDDSLTLYAFAKSSEAAAATILVALVNGYEIEKTAEEAAHDRIRAVYRRKIYSTFFADPTKFSRDKGFAEGIKYTLNELGVKIEGVNA